jgi:D-amino peptidase
MSDLLHSSASSSGKRRVEANHATEAISTSRRPAPRKAYVRIDMEGVSGVVSPEQVRPEGPEYEYGRRMLMHDLKAVLDGIFAAGCQEAVVYDAHLSGRNIDMDMVDGRAVVISGHPELLNGYFYGQDLSVAPLLLIGCHARAGTPQALLPRTYADDIAALRLNGAVMGELGIEAALAGEHGVPLVFVSGDSAAIGEARELLGSELQTVEVKTAISASGGICLPAARTGKMLRETAIRAVRTAAAAPPLVFQSPVTLDVAFTSPESAGALEGLEGIERMGELTVRCRGQSVVAAYRAFASARMKAAEPSLPPAAQSPPPEPHQPGETSSSAFS